mgnify:CR=1 FL=1
MEGEAWRVRHGGSGREGGEVNKDLKLYLKHCGDEAMRLL